MKRFLVGVVVGSILATSIGNAAVKNQEVIVDASEGSLATLNEQLRQIRATLSDHEQRLIGGGL